MFYYKICLYAKHLSNSNTDIDEDDDEMIIQLDIDESESDSFIIITSDSNIIKHEPKKLTVPNSDMTDSSDTLMSHYE